MTDNNMNFEGLQPEIFSGELTWLEFLEAFSELIEENIRSPIHELETIRDVIETTDPVVMSNTIKQMGFDIPADIISHNVDRLARAVYMLPLFHETAGTTEFAKAISFVLGRDTSVTYLYTRDYVDFYEKPLGAMNIDGGEWYKTTHIALNMEMVPSDSKLITSEDQTISDRLMDAFYEFAPVNLVIDRFNYIINMYGEVDITGTVFIEPDRHIVIGNGECSNRTLLLEGPSVVQEGTIHNYRLGYSECDYDGIILPGMPFVFFGTGGVSDVESFTHAVLDNTSSPQNLSLTIPDNEYGYFCSPVILGHVTFIDVALNIEGGWDGAGWPANGNVGPSLGPITITRNINGVDSEWYLYRTDFPSLGDFTFAIRFSSSGVPDSGIIDTGQLVPVSGADWSSSKTGLVSFNGRGQASFGRVGLDTPTTITAVYNGGVVTKDIIVEAYNDDIVSIQVNGPDELLRRDIATYSTLGVFKDGQTMPIDANLSLLSPYAVVSGNEVAVFNPPKDIDVYLTADYTSRSGINITTSKKITLKYVSTEVYLLGLTVIIDEPPVAQSVGADVVIVDAEPADVVVEGDTRQLRAIAEFSDGSTKEVQPLWETNSTALHVSTDGVATAGKPHGPVDVDIDATFEYRGVRAKTRRLVQVKNEDLFVENLSVLGSNTIVELTRAQYACVAHWSDGTVVPVEVEWSSDAFNISVDGILEAGSVDAPRNVTLTAKLGDISASYVVVVYDTPIVLQHLTIVGPDSVREDIVAQYTAYAHYSNGTDVEVTPDWSFSAGHSAVAINNEGQLTYSGTPNTYIVELQARYSVGIEAFVQTKPIVLVPNTAIITSLYISGPTSIEEGERAVLTATAVYEDGSVEQVNPQWYVQTPDPLNIPEPAADIVSPGIIQGRSLHNGDTDVVVVARYFKEIAELVVTVTDRPILSPDIPVSSRISGPPAFTSGQEGSYAHMITFNGSCGEIAVSSDWSIDVSPEIAIIDDDGFLHSVNGAGVPVTITSVYECGGYRVEDSILVTIIPENPSLDTLTVNGPSNVLTNSITPYVAELFRQGDDISPGAGVIVSGVLWSIVGASNGISINNAGELFISPDVEDGVEFGVKAMYTEGFESIEGTTLVSVTRLLPVYGTGPIAINTDSEISTLLDGEMSSSSSGQLVNFNIEPGTYGYFAYPVALGLARFIDQSNSIEGGWDGAAWPNDGSVGNSTGPLTISRTLNGVVSSWYLYRTNSSSLGDVTYRILFN